MKRFYAAFKPIQHFSKRKDSISCIILHYISAKFTSPSDPYDFYEVYRILRKERFSYHYVIDRRGYTYQLVEEDKKAWHAGVSQLHGEPKRKLRQSPPSVNDMSIGIALIGQKGAVYTDAAIDGGIRLCHDLKIDYRIPLNRIVGHEHVSPGRKVDPGPLFPWIQFLDKIAKKS